MKNGSPSNDGHQSTRTGAVLLAPKPKPKNMRSSSDQSTINITDAERLNDDGSPILVSWSQLPLIKSGERFQLSSEFLERRLFQMASGAEVKRLLDISTLARFLNTGTPVLPPLSAALDALCLSDFGAARSEKRFLYASHESYGRSLAGLQHSLRKGFAKTPESLRWEVIACMKLLSTFQACSAAADSNGMTWTSHWWAAQKCLSVWGPSGFDWSDTHIVRGLHSMWLSLLLIAIAERRRLDLGTEPWVEVQLQRRFTPWVNGYAEDAYRSFQLPLFEPVPGLIERTDSLLDNDSLDAESELRSLYADIQETRSNVSRFISVAPPSHVPQTSKVDDCPNLDLTMEEHCYLEASGAFDYVYRFPHPSIVVNFVSHRVVLLVLNCAILRLLHAYPIANGLSVAESIETIEKQTFDIATNLCRSIYDITFMGSVPSAQLSLMILGLAQHVFAEQKALREMGWCQAYTIAVETRMKRMEATRPPTLCLFGHLLPGLIEAGQYHSVRRTGQRVCPVVSPVDPLPE